MGTLKVTAQFDDKAIRAGLKGVTVAAGQAETEVTTAAKKASAERAQIAAEEGKAKVAAQREQVAQATALRDSATRDEKATGRELVAAEKAKLSQIMAAQKEAAAEAKALAREVMHSEKAAIAAVAQAQRDADGAMITNARAATKDQLANRGGLPGMGGKKGKGGGVDGAGMGGEGLEFGKLLVAIGAIMIGLNKAIKTFGRIAVSLEKVSKESREKILAAREDQQDRIESLSAAGITEEIDGQQLAKAATRLNGKVRNQGQVDDFLKDVGAQVQEKGGSLTKDEMIKLLGAFAADPRQGARIANNAGIISSIDPAYSVQRGLALNNTVNAFTQAGKSAPSLDPLLLAQRENEAQLLDAAGASGSQNAIKEFGAHAAARKQAIEAGAFNSDYQVSEYDQSNSIMQKFIPTGMGMKGGSAINDTLLDMGIDKEDYRPSKLMQRFGLIQKVEVVQTAIPTAQ